MNSRAQIGLEYLLIYGLAFVLIATIIGTLVFIVTEPASQATISSLTPTKLLVKGSSIVDDETVVKLQNLTGGEISVTQLAPTGSFSECNINPVSVAPGEITTLECETDGEAIGTVEVTYIDHAGLEQTVIIDSGNGSQSTTTEICNDGIDNDEDGYTDCEDPNCIGQIGPLGECELDFCGTEGEEFSYDGIDEQPTKCCTNLNETFPTPDLISVTDECYWKGTVSGIPDRGWCTHCGTGECDEHENVCNCPEDCTGKGLSDYTNTEEFCNSEYALTACAANPETPVCELCTS